MSAERLAALEDVAEAAHRANFDAPCEHCLPGEDCWNTRLADALLRLRALSSEDATRPTGDKE